MIATTDDTRLADSHQGVSDEARASVREHCDTTGWRRSSRRWP
ncbi:hypothetical protein ACIGNX_28240 [Actinosynnema sp. NPDC053489]